MLKSPHVAQRHRTPRGISQAPSGTVLVLDTNQKFLHRQSASRKQKHTPRVTGELKEGL